MQAKTTEQLQALQNARSSLLEQLNQLSMVEQRILSSNGAAAGGGPPSGPHSGSAQQQGVPPISQLQPTLAASDAHVPSALDVPAADPAVNAFQGAQYSRLASSLAALAHAQGRDQPSNGRVQLHGVPTTHDHHALPAEALEVDAGDFLRIAVDGTLPMGPEAPNSAVSLRQLSQTQTSMGGADMWSQQALQAQQLQLQLQQRKQLQLLQQQRQQQQQRQAQVLQYQLQAASAPLSPLDLPSHTLLPAGPQSSSHVQVVPNGMSAQNLHGHSAPLVTLSTLPGAANRVSTPLQSMQSATNNPGWPSNIQMGLGGTAIHQMAPAQQGQHILVSQLPQTGQVVRPSLQQWMVSKGVIGAPQGNQQAGVVLRPGHSPPTSAGVPVQTVLGPGLAIQTQPQQPMMHQVLTPQGWQNTTTISSGPLQDPNATLLTPVTHLGTPLLPASAPQLTVDTGLQQQLNAMAHMVHVTPMGTGSLHSSSRTGSGFAGLRVPGQSGSTGGSKRSGASRRRKAKMYQALNAMVQSVVEQGGDQDVAEAAAAAAAATLKGGVPNLQGGSAACASVVQAVFQQRLQLQQALRAMQQKGGSAGTAHPTVLSTGAVTSNTSGMQLHSHATNNTGAHSQPLMSIQHQLRMLQQQQHQQQILHQHQHQLVKAASDKPGAGEMITTNPDEGPVPTEGGVEWPAGFSDMTGPVPETELSHWQSLLQQLLQADATGTDVSSPTALGSGAGFRPELDAESEDGDEALIASLDTEELALLKLGGFGSESGPGGPSGLSGLSAATGSTSGRSLVVVGNGQSEAKPADLRWPQGPVTPGAPSIWAPSSGGLSSGASRGGSAAHITTLTPTSMQVPPRGASEVGAALHSGLSSSQRSSPVTATTPTEAATGLSSLDLE